MRRSHLVVVGDALLDRDVEGRVERVSPEAPVPVIDDPVERPRPGGAGLAATLAAADGHRVTLVTALADDPPGQDLRRLLRNAAVDVVDLGLEASTPEKIRFRAGGRSLLRLDRGAPGPVGAPGADVAEAVAAADAILVSDYGRGVAGSCRSLLEPPPAAPVVWDPHPRGETPAPGVRLATPNLEEARRFAGEPAGEGLAAITALARALATMWEAAGVAITLGARGALLSSGDGLPLVVPARQVSVADSCGAGDRFASAVAGLLADGAVPSEAVAGAVAAATEFVAAGGAAGMPLAAAPEPARERTAEQIVEAVHARRGTVVATSGCFDLVHAGHISTLEAARALGDCLIVCLNSDASVRRIKGPGRPVVPEADRAAVLRALDPVDAVVVFEEDTPEAVLERLRPDVFAKGGDYAVGDLPEARLLATWGGQAVVLPYVDGRSTTTLMKEVVRRGIA